MLEREDITPDEQKYPPFLGGKKLGRLASLVRPCGLLPFAGHPGGTYFHLRLG